MKILLFGKSGQVGWELQRSLAPLGEVVAPERHDTDLCGDLSNLAGISATVRQVRPNVIVNAAAYTAVDQAESDAAMAELVNSHAPGVLAEAASAVGALMVHYSTDYVFDGRGRRPWLEDDRTGPLNVYGRTKLEGERRIARHCSRYLVLRTSWVYAARGSNFAKTMLRLAGNQKQLKVINDQFGAPTGADLLADVTGHMVRRMQDVADDRLAGIYHVAASGDTSWHGYASFVLQSATRAGMRLKTSPDALLSVPAAAFPASAARPSNSRLDTAKLQRAFDLKLPAWQGGVARMLSEIA